MSPEARARRTIRATTERIRLIRQIGAMKMTGPGVEELLSAPTEVLRDYVQHPAQARQFVRLYNLQQVALDRLRPPASPTLPALLLESLTAAGGFVQAKALILWTVGCFSLASALLPREECCADLGGDE